MIVKHIQYGTLTNRIPYTNSRQDFTVIGLPCPACKVGTLIKKTGRYGPFVGCNRFPKCTHKVSR